MEKRYGGDGYYGGVCKSSYPIEKVGDFLYPYPYPVNAGIPRQNGDRFGQYPQGRVYLPSLHTHTHTHTYPPTHPPTHTHTHTYIYIYIFYEFCFLLIVIFNK